MPSMYCLLVALVAAVIGRTDASSASRDAPVPFSTSDTDGLPSKSNWDMFAALYQQAEADATKANQRKALLDYAAEQVTKALPEIRDNLKTLGLEGFDMVWPGDGFNGVAYGGLCEVLSQLEKVGVTKVGKRMGASGGAASTILTMAKDSDLFLKLYQVYELYYNGHPERVAQEMVRDTGLTAAIYAEAVRDDVAFLNAQQNAMIVSKCGGTNTIYHGFQHRTQLVAAGYSSGDASLGGAAIGTVINGSQSDVGHCCDGGGVTAFPQEVASVNFGVLLYQTPWVSVSQPTKESIDALFRAGVDNAIATLQSPDLRASAQGGSMLAVRPGPKGIVTSSEFAPIASEVHSPSSTKDINLASRIANSVASLNSLEMVV